MKSSALVLAALSGASLLSSSLHAETIYVDATPATTTNDGTSWANAYSSLQDALAAAVSGDEIWVAAGSYKPDQGSSQTPGNREATFKLKSGVALYGGFSGSESLRTDREYLSNITILSGDLNDDDETGGSNSENAYNVVTVTGTNNTATLDGFRISRGNANDESQLLDTGGAIYGWQGSASVANCTLSNNHAAWGGAIYYSDSSPTLTNCNVTNNTSSSGGGAIYLHNSAPTFNNCTISENSTAGSGGAALITNGSAPTFSHCELSQNDASMLGGAIGNGYSNVLLTHTHLSGNTAALGGGAIAHDSGTTLLRNSLIVANKADRYGGAISTQNNAHVELTNCTVTANTAGFDGGGLDLYEGSSLDATNSIIWNNKANGTTSTSLASVGLLDAGLVTYTNCIVDNSGGSSSWNSALGSNNGGNLDTSPLFLTPLNPEPPANAVGDFRLHPSSPAIDAADYDPYLTKSGSLQDILGNNRSHDSPLKTDTGSGSIPYLDMGPYEAPYDKYIYVNSNATGSSPAFPYSTWDTAANNLQDALTLAITGNEIRVAQGTYTPDQGASQTPGNRDATFQLKSGVGIFGGYQGPGGPGSPDARNPSSFITILSGDLHGDDFTGGSNSENSYNVVTGSGCNPSAILSGVTISYGNANGFGDPNRGRGAALYNSGGSPSIQDCIFTHNQASAEAGALLNTNSSPIITNCTFVENYSRVAAATSQDTSSAPVYTNCRFLRNSGEHNPAAKISTNCTATFTNCVFQENNATVRAGAIMVSGNSSATLTNCVFSGNKGADYAGAVLIYYGCNANITNCTFTGNSSNGDGGALYLFNHSSVSASLTNCIIWNNRSNGSSTSPLASIYRGNARASFLRCLVANSGGSIAWNPAIGTTIGGNLDLDPRFLIQPDPAAAPVGNGDLRLRFDSPAREAGENSANTEPQDILGDDRIQGFFINMGAYETIATRYETWAVDIGLTPGVNDGHNDNPDGDSTSNLLDFAFGLNPMTAESKLQLGGANGLELLTRGSETIYLGGQQYGVDYRAVFLRRKDRAAAGLTYTVQFSGDLVSWYDSSADPTLLGEDGEMELVSVNYPLFLPDRQKARFYRVSVSVSP